MGKILILNGSPRAPRSNSRQYAGIFEKYCPAETEYCEIRPSNHEELCRRAAECTDLLFVFPLYADSIPVTLLNFMKTLERNLPSERPAVSVLINCGFLEPEQNGIAVGMMRLYCRRYGFPFGSALMIGSGEAILQTPFRFLAERKIRRMARGISAGKYEETRAAMPLPKKLFLRAADAYWTEYGRKFGNDQEQMKTMKIEDGEGVPSRPSHM